jgi:hypothetical protein
VQEYFKPRTDMRFRILGCGDCGAGLGILHRLTKEKSGLLPSVNYSSQGRKSYSRRDCS